jgi:[ribosomal protein S5]-alanine N-acetyltransferase
MQVSLLTTDRLVLRAPQLSDAHAVFAIDGDPQTNRFNPTGPYRSLDQSVRRLQRWLDHWRTYGFGYWVITTRTRTETIIGMGGIMYREIAGAVRLNLYFRFRPAAWGQGYATEMGRAAIALGFSTLNQQQIFATVRPNNHPSIRTLERLGLQHVDDIVDEQGVSRLYVLERGA